MWVSAGTPFHPCSQQYGSQKCGSLSILGSPRPLGQARPWTEVTTPPLPGDRAFGLGGVTQSEQTPGKTHTLPRGPHQFAEMS